MKYAAEQNRGGTVLRVKWTGNKLYNVGLLKMLSEVRI